MNTLAVMCIAFTSTRPSRTPLAATTRSTSGVRFTNPRREGTFMVRYSVRDLMGGSTGPKASGSRADSHSTCPRGETPDWARLGRARPGFHAGFRIQSQRAAIQEDRAACDRAPALLASRIHTDNDDKHLHITTTKLHST